jgi:deoxyribodipyrimidine photo-lyase
MKLFVEQALFEPSASAAQSRLTAIRPFEYSQSRNHLDGAVSMLSPYLTHGFLTVPEVAAHVYKVHRMSVQHKFIFELAWREYFLHVHDALGDDIFKDLHEGVLPADAYSQSLPDDVRDGSTGVPVIDQAVRQLYFNGYLHNHARLWLASYLVHMRKVHWRVGADWMYSHLLDGDIASNHLSWQWVAGTGSRKPYLFNAANVAVHAPEVWHSPNTVIDKDMEIIEMISHSQATFTQKTSYHVKVHEPELLDKPPPEADLVASGLAADKLIDRDVWWIHPWSLSEQAPPHLPEGAMRVAACWHEWTQVHPWNTARWLFVARGMHQVASHCWFEDAARLTDIFSKARTVHVWDHRALPDWPGVHWVRHPAPRLWPRQEERSPSFSHWWSKVTRYKQSIPQLLRNLQGP